MNRALFDYFSVVHGTVEIYIDYMCEDIFLPYFFVFNTLIVEHIQHPQPYYLIEP